jgi:3-isopropylmalate/(R)-2-methylmalate dehydratase large subunit
MQPMTMAEKILSQKSGESVCAGDYCVANIDLAMVQEMLAYMVDTIEEIGIPRVWNAERIVVFFDHYAPAPTEESASMHKKMRAFAEKYRIENTYGINEGICHQVLSESGRVLPSQLIVGTDSHTTTYGALGAASTGIGLTEMINVFESGTLWFYVPHTLLFRIEGTLGPYMTSKDVMLEIAGRHGTEVAQYKSVEFSGSCVSRMSISSRMTLSNMVVEIGGKFGLFATDAATHDFLKKVGNDVGSPMAADPGASYEEIFHIDAGEVQPKVACPHSLANVRNASELDIKIDQAFLGSCTNGRYEDMAMAAEILKGRKIAHTVRMIVTPASRKIYLECVRNGIAEIFIRAGAVFTNPTCGACFGGHMGVLAEGEKVISSSNRNFKGRMGHPDSEIYLASPATVAASAIRGRITDPRDVR